MTLFFYPIHHIGFVHSQDFAYAASADPAVVHFDRQFSRLLRVRMLLRIDGVINAALLTLAALTSRSIVPSLDLVLYSSTFRALFPCLFCSLSHDPYYIIKSLFRTLPTKLQCNEFAPLPNYYQLYTTFNLVKNTWINIIGNDSLRFSHIFHV